LRNIHRVLLGRLNHYGLFDAIGRSAAAFRRFRSRSLRFDFLLWGVLQRSRFHRPIAKSLNSVHDIIRLVVVRLSQCGCPRQTVIHRFEYVAELRQRSDAGVPRLRVYCLRELIALEIRILFKPSLRFDYLGRESRRDQDACHQQVWIESDG
jgi:hypothetical protein